MELVPSNHDGIKCNGCNVEPIKGVRFKCKTCENYDYCENCFYTKKNHRHAFNRIVEAGKYLFIKKKLINSILLQVLRKYMQENQEDITGMKVWKLKD